MSPRTVEWILAEWRELEHERESVSDAEIEEGLIARIAQVRHEYSRATGVRLEDDEAPIPEQLRLPL